MALEAIGWQNRDVSRAHCRRGSLPFEQTLTKKFVVQPEPRKDSFWIVKQVAR